MTSLLDMQFQSWWLVFSSSSHSLSQTKVFNFGCSIIDFLFNGLYAFGVTAKTSLLNLSS